VKSHWHMQFRANRDISISPIGLTIFLASAELSIKVMVTTDTGFGCYSWAKELSARELTETTMTSEIGVNFHQEISDLHSKEYLEAVVAGALKFVYDHEELTGSMVVFNRRGVAAALSKEANRCIVVPAILVERIIPEPMKDRLRAWLDAPDDRFHIVQLADVWSAIADQLSSPS